VNILAKKWIKNIGDFRLKIKQFSAQNNNHNMKAADLGLFQRPCH
jgi:hypothetical protein